MGQGLKNLPVLFLLSACVLPYQPSTLRVAIGEDTFDRILFVLRDDYPSLADIDRTNHRVQSAWSSCDDRGQPAQRRLSLFMDDPGEVSVLVEVRYLQLGWFGEPSWTSPQGHRPWETKLLSRIAEAF